MSSGTVKKDTRDRIITESRKIFAQKGFDSTSMTEIAKSVGIEKGSLYYFFENKEDLFAAVVADIWVGLLEGVRTLAENRKPDPTTQLSDLLSEVIERSVDTGLALHKLDSVSMQTLSKIHERFRPTAEVIHQIQGALVDFLKKHKVPNPELAREVITNAIAGYVLQPPCSPVFKPKPKEYAFFLTKLFIN